MTNRPATSKSHKKSGLLIVAALAVSLILSLAVGELALRAMGYKPWAPWSLTETTGVNEDIGKKLAEPEPLRAWVNRPGTYQYPGYSPAVDQINVNIRPDGGRYTSTDNPPFNPEQSSIIFVGGSITMGFAISDNETFAWKTKALYPERNVFNYGVPGYGTYQSLLTLENVLPEIPGPKIIFYGLMEHHLNRNVLDATWMHVFATPGKGTLPPYVSLDKSGELQRHPASNRTPWYLKDNLAMVQLAEKSYIDMVAKGRNKDERKIFLKLLAEIETLGNENDAKVVVLFLKIGDKARPVFSQELAEANIAYAECMDERNYAFEKEYTVIGEGHPNGRMNTIWANCISDYIEQHGL